MKAGKMKERNFSLNPYTPDEQKVVRYLHQIMPDIGAGDDPIQFLIASHAMLIDILKAGRKNVVKSDR